MWLADLFQTSKDDKFFILLKKQAALLLEGTRTLERYIENGDVKLADEVERLEHQGDELIAALIKELRGSFVTPFDRQDIYALGEGIDDMLDYVNNAAREYRMFHAQQTPEMLEMMRILVHAAEEIEQGIQDVCGGAGDAYAHARQAAEAENKMEHVYREALAKLFEGDDMRTMFRLREIYRHLSNSADRADAIAKTIARILVVS